MGFANYTALKAEIQSFLWDRTDVVSRIPSFIELAEAEMKRLLRTQQCNLVRPYSISFSQGALPSNSRAIHSVVIDLPANAGTKDLTYVTPEQVAAYNFVTPGQPRFYGIDGDRLRFYPDPDQTYTGTIHYRAPFDPLSDSNISNWILEQHPDMYLSGALKWAKRWLIDSDQDWETPFFAAIEQANRDEPMIQVNSRMRTDEVAIMGGVGGRYNIFSDSYTGVR